MADTASPMLDDLIAQVRRNARISDAGFWGYYSTCGLLMRLRSLYRFEHGIAPWEHADESGIPAWIGALEGQWRSLEDASPSPITIGGREYDPYDTAGINAALSREGHLYYGMGQGLYMKPVIFLAELAERRTLMGRDVVITGHEFVRDLSTHPAMHRGGTIIVRRSLARELIWDRYSESCSKDRCSILRSAFSAYGVQEGSGQDALGGTVDDAVEVMVRHELGESVSSGLLGSGWIDMLAALGHSRTALDLRAIKDAAADTCPEGPLSYIIEGKMEGQLGFFVASFGGLRGALCPEVRLAYNAFLTDHDWTLIDSARKQCHENSLRLCKELLRLYASIGARAEFSARVSAAFG